MTKISLPDTVGPYCAEYTTPEMPVLAALNRETNMKVHGAVMISGHMQGMFLQMMSQAIRPKYILELGTFTGYSAICLAQGLQPGGLLHTIDVDEELEDMAVRYFEEAGLKDKIVTHIGKAAEIIPALKETFDLVFIDADKNNYDLYFDLVIDKLSQGGFILADNVLYEGDVLLPAEQQSKNARAMQRFNDKIRADDRVEQIMLPLRDGMMIIRKK
ncbi:methyltransferase [Flavipsychrobacter stenotrophus]|uniref:Methyltransferase n=1 Tax=Flavipsychrobacter stenotrophus TaxID=2077091 RepID=A0A2S7SWT1_9BACT|nr:O-methyltransferase [Flavipsychrobacter stenotrophus]PQJ11067.1 methyltransferase [Flavipsychrobacter stenotrophus]